jgi:methyltransferase-like protein/2-polyprenyl-3-methyl-5-hydroxy-6-metoxy-1,4-benzoquinol methylase
MSVSGKPSACAEPSTTRASSYDDFPYESFPYPQTHPDRLAAIATLFGMRPAPVERCRILELGCAGGGNLIPMALALPGSHFLGIDLSKQQIADGQKLLTTLGLKNIELRHLSILDVDAAFGLFDYIICHGVYSWVPSAVQEKILAICACNLAPQGVAFVSYNTYPGWHMSGMIRDMLRYHAGRFAQPQQRVNQARALLTFLAAAVANDSDAYSSLLKEGLEVFAKVNNSYLLHEYLEDVNEPLYFHQFIDRLKAHGLQYLAEAEVHAMVADRFGPEIAGTVEKLSSDFIEMEQFLDFLRNRKFRQTLVCHGDAALERQVSAAVLSNLHVASSLKAVSENPDLASSVEEQFRNPRGRTPSTTEPILKAALVHLAEHWPEAVPFAALAAAARARFGGNPAAGQAGDRDLLGKSLLQLYSANLIELHSFLPPLARQVPEHPRATPLARLQAAAAGGVTNLRHECVPLSDLERNVLVHLDGSRDRAALLEHLADLVKRGLVSVQEAGQPVHAPEKIRSTLMVALDQCLVGLAQRGLLWTG